MKHKLIAMLGFCLFLHLKGSAQQIFVNGKESDGKLSWSDFTGKVDNSSPFNAYTAYKYRTQIESIKTLGDSVQINGFNVVLELDQKNSWAKKDRLTDELLTHEQGHFNLGILCVQEIMTRFKEARFTKSNYNSLLQKILTETSKKYNELGLKYDKETQHSKNKEQQNQWNAFFAEELK